MAKKFVDPIGGRDFPHGTLTWSRFGATLPNGDPFWLRSGSGDDLGSLLPSGTDFVTHDWSIDIWIRDYISGWGSHQPIWVGLTDGSNAVWTLIAYYNTRLVQFAQNTTTDTVYRARQTAAAFTEGVRAYIAVTCAAGGTPNIYLNGVLSNGTSTAPSGTPKVVTSGHRFKLSGWSASSYYATLAKPAYYPKVLTPAEIANIYSAMESA